jgi:hypothetical protein
LFTCWRVRETEGCTQASQTILSVRLVEHKSGAVEGFTKEYGVQRLVWYESWADVSGAITVKSGSSVGGANGNFS